jgi:hypothetical protein
MTRHAKSRLVSRSVVLLLVSAFFVVTGCEAIVGEASSNVACIDAPGVCPDGWACVGGTCTQCPDGFCGLLGMDAGHDAGHDTGVDVTVPVDTGHDAGHDVGIDTGPPKPEASVLAAIGEGCDDNTACVSGLCVASQDLNGVTIVGAASVCSLACCTSADCNTEGTTGNVCYPTEAGGLCINATQAGTCGANCGTSCCMKADCSGQECASSTTSFGGSVPSCQQGGGGGDGSNCNGDSDCDDGVCGSDGLGDTSCVSANTCCSDADCTGGAGACQWVTVNDADGTSMPVFRSCYDMGTGGKATGQPCTTGTDCVDGLCLKLPGQTASLCTQACCNDTNCSTAVARWICEPDSIQVSADVSVTLFVCGPPS